MVERDPMKEPMLVKFRRKFVVTNMIFAAAVLVVVGIAAGYMNYSQQQREVYEALDRALIMDGKEASAMEDGPGLALDGSASATAPEAQGGSAPDKDRRESADDMFVATAVYDVSADYAVTERNDALSLDDDTLQSALYEAYGAATDAEDGKASGLISPLDLYYRAQVADDGTVEVAFASAYYVRQSVTALLRSLVLPFTAALAGFFVLSVLLSRWSVGPVARAWQQQQQFVADASHELKTPLAVILANNAILVSDPEATVESQMQWVESTETEAHLMQGLVNDMLYLAQAESGGREAQLADVDFSEVVQGVALQFESVAFERGVMLQDDIQQGLKVHGDPAQLQRLVGTLVDNACKYADAGGHVRVELARAGSKCRLDVTNSGTPIDPQDLPHLFDRFYRSDKARTRETGGFGLGLSIAKGIVEGMGGSISATSSEEAGTCFSVTLPIA